MQLAIHMGVHCTDDDRVLKTLLNNKGILAKECISIPGPGRYRGQLVKVVQKLRGAEASADTCDMLLDEIVDDDTTQRVVLTHENFICIPNRIFDEGVLYDRAGYKPMWLRNTFPNAKVEFFLAIRNPATFIPAVFHHPQQKTENFSAFMNGTDILDIHWSDVILAIQESNPGCQLTVWCNEDTPLIWPEIIREISGYDSAKNLRGGFDVLATIMKKEGMRRMRAYLRNSPPQTENQRRRILAAFLDKYLIEEAVEEELDVPGWTDELVARLTQIYEDDLYEIESMPGVNFITP